MEIVQIAQIDVSLTTTANFRLYGSSQQSGGLQLSKIARRRRRWPMLA